ncbi:hypothetical protein DFH08DRAFT_723825 [Mycena albidolilacea]|uniref:Uncharacterized protein n=1 Tax=Mycena albidolilacea TaxID=1033008 RepID=A0AAD6YZR0_9AGAR|nr:hypothetical protein DFH08DRAFT_723873 [Mycena albidolilacea]KAJ7301789.1 hypothetical protein DFH08DRAFT_723825 [Mycena albidolilacea]
MLKGLDSVNSTDCPSTAPQWFAKAHQHVTQVDLGAHYNAVLAAWIRMEKASRFEQGQDKLPAKGRPPSISVWMRAKVSPPKIGDVSAFATAWQQWWDSLQPGWRTKRSDGSWKVEDGYGGKGEEWGDLYTWGPYGVASVVAGLYMWGFAVRDDITLRAAWEAASSDVGWVLEGMAAYYERFNW